MPTPHAIAALSGQWTGRNTLHDPTTGQDEVTDSTLTVTPVLNGTFLRIDYTWSWQGAPQHGSILMNADGPEVQGAWVDTWHNGRSVFACAGRVEDDGSVRLDGTYPAPDGPDWGWGILLCATKDGGLRVQMVNRPPGSPGEPAVEAVYRRREDGDAGVDKGRAHGYTR